MNGQDYEQLTLFPVDSPVNLSALPGNSVARQMTVSSGRRCAELYPRSGRLGCLVRMCLESSIWHSTKCYLTWKVSDMKRKRLLYRLVVSMPRTSDTECALWPTVTATVHGKKRYVQGGKPLTMAYVEKFGDKALDPEFVEWMMGYEQRFTGMLPTISASDYRGAPNDRFFGGGALPQQPTGNRGSHSAWDNWEAEPDVDRVVNGLPYRVDRIRCLGNAVVPQQFYPFFDAIAKIEKEKDK